MKNIVLVDLETTGVDPVLDRVVEVGIVHYDSSGTRTEKNWLVNPGCKMSQEVIDIHGITNEQLVDCPKFSDIAQELYNTYLSPDVTKIFCAYNFSFDYKFLQEELKRLDVVLNNGDYIFLDPCAIFKHAVPHTLEAAVKLYTGKPHENAHRALDDIKATEEVLKQQMKEHSELFKNGLKQLQLDLLGSCEILSSWFDVREDGAYLLKGKHKGEKITKKHFDYLSWISKLNNTTETEREFIRSLFSKCQ